MRMTLLAPLLAAIHGTALAEPLTYEAALERAASGAPSVLAGEAGITATRSAALAAAELPDPRLQAGIMNLPVTGPNVLDPVEMTMFQVGVEQEIPNLAKRHARAGLASSEIGLAEARLELTAREVRVAAGTAWIELAYAQRRLELAGDAEAELEKLVPVANSAVASGSARPAESLEIRRSIIELQDAVTTIEAEREAAQALLQRYVPVSEPVAAGPMPSSTIEPEHLRPGLERHPELQLSDAGIERAEAQVRLAEAERRPDFGASVNYGVRDRQFGDVFSVMGSITLPIFVGRRQEPRIAAAEAEARAARFRLEDQRRQLAAEFEADLAEWRSAYRQWRRASEELLPLARDRATFETASFAAGRAELTDVVAAKTALALLELEILRREADTAKAAETLRLNYGEDER